jgi:hypothetical protein
VCAHTLPADVIKRRAGSVPKVIEWIEADASARVFVDVHELSLGNECILWRVPRAIERWLDDDDSSVVVAEDVTNGFEDFTHLAGPEPRTPRLRGVSPSFDLEGALRAKVHVVSVDDVSICSPFPTHRRELGACGAHFHALNEKRLGWEQDGRPAETLVAELWRGHALEIRKRVARAARISLLQPGPGSPAPP